MTWQIPKTMASAILRFARAVNVPRNVPPTPFKDTYGSTPNDHEPQLPSCHMIVECSTSEKKNSPPRRSGRSIYVRVVESQAKKHRTWLSPHDI
jgi:hypothetical protein